MKEPERLIWWDKRTGSEFIADRVGDRWNFWEREWGGVRWYQVNATPELLNQVDLLRHSLASKVA